MTTQYTHAENNDWQEPVGEQLSASASSPSREHADASLSEEQVSSSRTSAETAFAMPGASSDEELASTQVNGSFSFETFSFQETLHEGSETDVASLLPPVVATTEEVASAFTPDAEVNPANLPEADPELFPLELEQESVPTTPEEVRPFTDFIEEFRQREVRLNALLREAPEMPFVAFVAEGEQVPLMEDVAAGTASEAAEVAETVPQAELIAESAPLPTVPEQAEVAPVESELPLAETRSTLTQPTLPAERPVSPLLRPATRIRLPRHGRHRIEELIQPGEIHHEPAKPVAAAAEPVAEEKPAEPAVEEQPARPARRYRFDRPATTTTPASAATPAASATPAKSSTPAASLSSRTASSREKREHAASAEHATTRAANNGATPVAAEVPVNKTPAQEATPARPIAEVEIPAPAPATSERRRRGTHERQREKEQAAAQATPIPQETVPEPTPAPVEAQEIPIEDLPPLEYAELQAASSRRRRRRRTSSTSNPMAASNGSLPELVAQPPLAATPLPTPPPSSVVPLPRSGPSMPVQTPTLQSYNIVSGYTVSQMNQGNELGGPFMGPEPSPARGSTFTTSPTLRHARAEALRSATPTHSTKHTEGSALMSPASVNYLAQTLAQAVQTQTDRMVAELRRSNQVPTNVSVSLPPFPSTERVGVFVDVANLLYSARTLRMTVDFGKLLDFLRGNRRLVRAQAYCPTSPQPGDDQMFLQAVKGLGYRITTKNYKTFSSGAKKADLDLDLCMDVVRLVDGKAVDCIVLVSGDSDFMPMLDYCSDHGVRVEVAAFDESMSATLRQSCDLFVNLSMLEEIRS